MLAIRIRPRSTVGEGGKVGRQGSKTTFIWWRVCVHVVWKGILDRNGPYDKSFSHLPFDDRSTWLRLSLVELFQQLHHRLQEELYQTSNIKTAPRPRHMEIIFLSSLPPSHKNTRNPWSRPELSQRGSADPKFWAMPPVRCKPKC